MVQLCRHKLCGIVLTNLQLCFGLIISQDTSKVKQKLLSFCQVRLDTGIFAQKPRVKPTEMRNFDDPKAKGMIILC